MICELWISLIYAMLLSLHRPPCPMAGIPAASRSVSGMWQVHPKIGISLLCFSLPGGGWEHAVCGSTSYLVSCLLFLQSSASLISLLKLDCHFSHENQPDMLASSFTVYMALFSLTAALYDQSSGKKKQNLHDQAATQSLIKCWTSLFSPNLLHV